jgi:cyclomaltodextrin glucanotransferase
VPFDQTAGGILHCKFVILGGEAGFQHENLVSRQLLLPQSGRIKFDCVWGSH